MYGEYFGEKKNRMIPFFIHYLRMWDVASSQRVDNFLCVSKHVQNRIMKFYRREAEVIHPPVEISRFRLGHKKEDFFLIVSSLVPYKMINLAIEAFDRLGYPLRIIGSGPEEKKLRAIAKSNIKFLGWQPNEIVTKNYSACRALVFPGEEDFGIVPLEAMGCGKPVIAYGKGGILETVLTYDASRGGGSPPTGLFFQEPKVDSLIDAIERFIQIEEEFDPSAIRQHALQWDREIFKEKIKKSILGKLELRC
jgi:glycosyltransferase involved in cell wall biosynthesis